LELEDAVRWRFGRDLPRDPVHTGHEHRGFRHLAFEGEHFDSRREIIRRRRKG
jgi:hypothetical protein